MTRQRLAATVALLIAVMIAACSGSQTVPSSVLYDSQGAPANQAQRVYDWGADELAHLEAQGFELPPMVLSACPSVGPRGITVATAEPVRYSIVLFYGAYIDEAQIRKTAAHEAAHVLMIEAGKHPPGEEGEKAADGFAVCFGSAQAKAFALKWGRNTEPDCEEIRNLCTKP